MADNVEKNINHLVKIMLKDYNKGRDIDISNNFIRPDKTVIKNIIFQLKNLIFPEFFINENYNFYTIKNNLSFQIEDLLFNLSKQISIVLKYLPQYSSMPQDERLQKSKNLAIKFLKKLPKIRELIQTDLQAAYDGDPAAFNKAEILFSYPGLFAIMTNRLAHELYLLKIPLIPRIMTEYAHAKTGIDIHPGATLGEYFFIDHGTGIVIGETAIVGNNVKIYQGVTIGALSTKDGQKLHGKKRHPTIQDNVIIYANASILGGETVIGHDCVIGGNAFITKSIPCNTKVSIKNQELIYTKSNIQK